MRRPAQAAIATLVLGLGIAGPTPAPAQVACADCHDLDQDAYAETVHGFLGCSDCHAGAEDVPHDEDPGQVDCSVCHEQVVEEYLTSSHGLARENGSDEAPTCDACHGPVHSLYPASSERSRVHPSRLPDTCGTCHADPEMVAKYGIPVAFPIQAYQASIHATARAGGAQAATCSSCHGSHALYSAADPRSLVNHQRVAETCGACHRKIAKLYDASVHGKAAAHGAREAPVCTDCHGEHRILSPRQEASPVYVSNVPKMTCGRCHGDLRLIEKYGITGGQVPAYEDSYHGLAARAGTVTVAHCGSCHGVHDIQPASDPTSHIHPSNLAATCGQCHPGAGSRFAIGPVHVLGTENEHRAVYYVRLVYLWLIYLTIGGMFLHNILDLRSKIRNPPRFRPADRRGDPPLRMPSAFRWAHGVLILPFTILLYTGFSLTYPESWWARPLLQWEEELGLRGWLHRGAAVILMIDVFFHLVHLVLSRTARRCIARMRPSTEDWREFSERMGYYVGRRPSPPAAPWLGYPEKLEYLALMWGIGIMALTGFLLWFDDLLLRWLPKWVADVATAIHFYEAVLASLAILVWHLYFVIFDPVVYPMDQAWLTGRSAPGREQERAEGE